MWLCCLYTLFTAFIKNMSQKWIIFGIRAFPSYVTTQHKVSHNLVLEGKNKRRRVRPPPPSSSSSSTFIKTACELGVGHAVQLLAEITTPCMYVCLCELTTKQSMEVLTHNSYSGSRKFKKEAEARCQRRSCSDEPGGRHLINHHETLLGSLATRE